MDSKFKLIDGSFSVEEAREVIGNLLDFKIQYHNKQIFGSEIRNGIKDEKSLARKEVLKKTKADFMSYLSGLPDTFILNIHSEISIKNDSL